LLTFESTVCELLSERTESLPHLDHTLVESFKALADEFAGSGEYDVLLIDCPRLIHRFDDWDKTRAPCLRFASEVADLILVPLKSSYPYLDLSPHPCFFKDMSQILSWRGQLNALFLMNEVVVSDEGEKLKDRECSQHCQDFERRIREFLRELNIPGTFLAKARIGNREAYRAIGCPTYENSKSEVFEIRFDGRLRHDMEASATSTAAKWEIEQLWTEVVAHLPHQQKEIARQWLHRSVECRRKKLNAHPFGEERAELGFDSFSP
jgi:hypothetical protein